MVIKYICAKMIMYLLTLYSIIVLFFSITCEAQITDTFQKKNEIYDIIEIDVNHYRVASTAEGQGLFYLFKVHKSKEWSIYFGEINGLDYEWGYIYHLKVKRKKVRSPMSMIVGINYLYELIEIVYKEKVAPNEKFEMKLDKSYFKNFDTLPRSDSLVLLDGTNVVFCSDGLLQKTIEQLKIGNYVHGIFRHSEEKNIIKLVEIK
ncbi:MAG: hypothetical protein SCALA701_09020 [Candidatus Scalindua sp.]|nr:DUF4377 domain-containing protein [Planctomycetota bacterium]RZV93899.1 MAG: DUF4377 domain-containing protein [Candidatus Scalindua sp. SCAELEC01]GJQ58101.1 MAG: hypothetical protein SCALA701_09020 [Candidatus Scalindua sp.]